MRLTSIVRTVVLSAVFATVLGPLGGSFLKARTGIETGMIGTAHAQARFVADRPYSGRRPIELNVRLSTYYGYGWYDNLGGFNRYGYNYYGGYAAGPGVQMLFPVVKNGFIPGINNAFYVGFFSDFMFHPFAGDYFVSLTIGPMVQWRFFLLDMFDSGGLSVFANLGFGIWPWFFGDNYGPCRNCGTVVTGFPLFQLGANLFFTRNVGLTLNFGYPSANIGVSFGF